MKKLNLKYKPFDVHQLVNEASVGGAGGIAGFTGRGGQDIDDIFMGGFFPNDNLVIDLEQQLVDTSRHREFSDKNTPAQKKKWKYLDTNLEYDDIADELDKEKYKNETDKMKSIKLVDEYTDVKNYEDMSIYKNETNEWKSIISLSDVYKEI